MVFCNTTDRQIIYRRRASHNPYFNRWFSAISNGIPFIEIFNKVTILILIDGFLQSRRGVFNVKRRLSQSLF